MVTLGKLTIFSKLIEPTEKRQSISMGGFRVSHGHIWGYSFSQAKMEMPQ
jgi:hypothetical protein